MEHRFGRKTTNTTAVIMSHLSPDLMISLEFDLGAGAESPNKIVVEKRPNLANSLPNIRANCRLLNNREDISTTTISTAQNLNLEKILMVNHFPRQIHHIGVIQGSCRFQTQTTMFFR
ncbi:hypothetical protein PIB30_029276 [Stylosanthes scabra]|uniref:Uncharacterized protein n=1 Tax=Stylosanthes scabra TaxID=79078 RepID=A0ABU6VC30_9FABA|nr:hypothetical protein [Stylosanthes scabra]